jgi:hypothetical protein
VPPIPGFIVGWDDPNKLRDAELEQLAWQVERERQARQEQERWRQSPALPPMEKVMLNWVATAPARGVLGLLAMSGPGRRAEAEEQMRKLRPLPCSPAEEEACGAVETMLDQTVLLLGPAAAETALVRGSTLLAAREAATAAGRGAEFAAAEASALAGASAAEVGESAAPRFAGLLDRFTARLNPANYEVRGLGSNFGNVRYRGPQSGPRSSSEVDAVADHVEEAAARRLTREVPTPQADQAGVATEASLEELSNSAAAMDRGGFTGAGRSLQKHGSRGSVTYPEPRGSRQQINQAGQHVADDILTTPGATVTRRHHARYGEVIEVWTPDGRGMRYRASGEFIGFLEP